MPSAIPTLPSTVYIASGAQDAGPSPTFGTNKSEPALEHTDGFSGLFLTALMGTQAVNDENPASLDGSDDTMRLPADCIPDGEKSTAEEEPSSDDLTAPLAVSLRNGSAPILPTNEAWQLPQNRDGKESFDGRESDNASSRTETSLAALAETSAMTAAANAVLRPPPGDLAPSFADVSSRTTSQNRVAGDFISEQNSTLLEAPSSRPSPAQQGIPASSMVSDSFVSTDATTSAITAPILGTTLSPDSGTSAAFEERQIIAPKVEPGLDGDPLLAREAIESSAEVDPSSVSSTSTSSATTVMLNELEAGSMEEGFGLNELDRTETQDNAVEPTSWESVSGSLLSSEVAGRKTATASETHAAGDVDPAPASAQLASSLVSHARLSTKDKETQFEMQLDPPELGRVTVQLRQSEAGLRAQIVVAREATVPILERELPILQATLENAGFTVEDFDVSHHNGDGMFQDDDREFRFAGFDDEHDAGSRSVRAVVPQATGTGEYGVGRIDLQA